MDVRTFDRKLAAQFRAAYKDAVSGGKETFTFPAFGDAEVLTAYAKYLCEYLEHRGLLTKE